MDLISVARLRALACTPNRTLTSFATTTFAFFPAWAGITNATRTHRHGDAVHPRVGGEHGAGARRRTRAAGSSPRGRGTRQRIRCTAQMGRFIPAWAGNTNGTRPSCQQHPVHPRVGGEHQSGICWLLGNAGSSPRGRGTRPARCPAERSRRFIPAWAGNTRLTRPISSRNAVHPRVGGEHRLQTAAPLGIDGSSPRGRGTLSGHMIGKPSRRFIPAWAGNTCTSQ